MKNILACIFLGVLLSSNIMHAQVVADTFYVPNYPIPEIYYTDDAPELPENVWNHKLKYFPQFYYNQHNLPNCGQASGHFNCLTFEFNRLYRRIADSSNIFSPTHIYNFLNGGNGYYGVSTFDSWNAIMSQGCMTLSDFTELEYIAVEEDEDEGPKYRGQNWENGYQKYFNGMHNKISNYYSLNTTTDEDLKVLMHYFNDHLKGDSIGGVAIFYANSSFFKNAYSAIFDTLSPEQQTIFYDSTIVVVNMGGYASHSMTLTGYSKNEHIDFNDDGLITDTIDINDDGVIDIHDNETILWNVVNSWGDNWDNSHCLFKYDLLNKIWNDQVFIPIPDTAYKPELTIKCKIKHPCRRDIKISTGISADLNTKYPEKQTEFPIWNFQGGQHGMSGIDTLPNPSIIEFGLDITDTKDLLTESGQYQLFVNIENFGEHTAELHYLSIIDLREETPQEHILIDNPTTLKESSINHYSSIFNLNSESNSNTLEVSSPTKIKADPNKELHTQITPTNGQEPYSYHILQEDEYNVFLSNVEFDFDMSNIYVNLDLDWGGYIYTSNPKIIEPSWNAVFAGDTIEIVSVEQSGTIGINYLLKFSHLYPYRSLKKTKKYLQINPHFISEHHRKDRAYSFANRDSAIIVFEKTCVYDGWEGHICDNDYIAFIFPTGEIQIIYSDDVPQNQRFANIKTFTNSYDITNCYEIPDTFNTVTFTPNLVDSLFTIDENGVLTMLAVSEPGKYETYVLVRDADGQEFTKRIEVNVINENIIGKLYPNPTKDILYCDIYNPTEQNTTIEIFTITGQCVYKETALLPAGITEHNFNTTQFGQGVYLLKISMGGNSQTQRFVVTK